MNREEFINTLQDSLKEENVEVSKSDLNVMVNRYHEVIIDLVTKGDTIQFKNFGSYTFIEKKETKGRNPQTGAEMIIPARKQPKFKPGLQFKNAVNNIKKEKPATKKKPSETKKTDKKKK